MSKREPSLSPGDRHVSHDVTASGETPPGATVTLRTESDRFAAFGCAAIVAAVFAGCVGVAAGAMYWADGDAFSILLFPAVITSVYCAVAAWRLLRCLSPQIHLTLPGEPLVLGDTFTVDWMIAGDVARIRNLSIQFVGLERISYSDGTRTVTETSVFSRQTGVSFAMPERIGEGFGRFELTIPANTMHSFDADNNEVRWALVAKGAVCRRPPIGDEWTVWIHPIKPERGLANEGSAPMKAELAGSPSEERP